MALYIRGFNPIWTEFNLQGLLFDDSYYMFVLENTLPYIPAPVYHEPDGTVWTNPIQFLANGTLPVDIYFDPELVYRLEFRQGPTQNDPLIYEVNNYIANGTGGSEPIDTLAFTSSNQITNPQFALTSFVSPYTVSGTDPDHIEVAPGWFLELGGTGTAVITKVSLNDDNTNPSNAPYALELTLSGWDSEEVFLRQRFQQNGMLWAEKTVSSAITARIEGSPQSISANLVDSNNSILAQVLEPTDVNSAWNEYTGHGTLEATTNPDFPPTAYIDYKLALPNNVDIYLTSIQLIVQEAELLAEPVFEQNSIERQIDQTFHFYKDSLILQPKESLLTGWDFALNPWQNRTTTSSNLATFGYTADQTIMIQQAYVNSTTQNNIQVGQASFTEDENYGFKVTAVTATNQFAMIQYIDPLSMRPYWQETVSALVKLFAQKQSGNTLRMKMKLIYRSSLPPTMTQNEPIVSWSALGEPVFAGGWTALTPKNDPVYNIVDGDNTLTFEGFELPVSDNADMTLGIVIYTLNPMVQSGTADYITFKKVSLVPNEFATDCNVLSFDETLRKCFYYLESSKNLYTLLTNSEPGGALLRQQVVSQGLGLMAFIGRSFEFEFNTTKRRSDPTITLYSDEGTISTVGAYIRDGGATLATLTPLSVTNWTDTVIGNKAAQYLCTAVTSLANFATGVSVNGTTEAFISFHYLVNAQLGV